MAVPLAEEPEIESGEIKEGQADCVTPRSVKGGKVESREQRRKREKADACLVLLCDVW